MKLEDICEAITAMTPVERSRIRMLLDSMAEADADAWDRQIEEDARNGKLDKLADEALADFRAGRCREFDGVTWR